MKNVTGIIDYRQIVLDYSLRPIEENSKAIEIKPVVIDGAVDYMAASKEYQRYLEQDRSEVIYQL